MFQMLCILVSVPTAFTWFVGVLGRWRTFLWMISTTCCGKSHLFCQQVWSHIFSRKPWVRWHISFHQSFLKMCGCQSKSFSLYLFWGGNQLESRLRVCEEMYLDSLSEVSKEQDFSLSCGEDCIIYHLGDVEGFRVFTTVTDSTNSFTFPIYKRSSCHSSIGLWLLSPQTWRRCHQSRWWQRHLLVLS